MTVVEQAPEPSDGHRRSGAFQDGPQQDLVRLQNEASGPALQVVDGVSGLKAVPADEDRFGAVAEVLRDPLDDHGRLDLTRIVGKVRQPSIDDLEALAAEVLGAEFVEQGPEPRRVDETDALDVSGPQRRHR
jgi:hypothetical protein